MQFTHVMVKLTTEYKFVYDNMQILTNKMD